MSTISTNLGMIIAEGPDVVDVTDHVSNNLTILDNSFNANTPSIQAIGDSASMGSALVVSRSDHKHGMPAFGTPVSIGIAISAGLSANIARADHVHDAGTGTVGTTQLAAGIYGAASALDGTTANGSASTLSRSDHKHAMAFGSISSVGTANSNGVATTAARSDHVHNIGTGAINASTMFADGVVTAVKTDNGVGRNNLLVNGGQENWLKGAGPFTGSGTTCADGWLALLTGGSSIQVDRDSANADSSSQYCAKVVYTHVSGGGYYYQIIPISNEARGRPVTFTVRVKTSTASAVRAYIDDGVSGLIVGSHHTGSGAYETLSVTGTPTASATMIRCYVVLEATATAYIDNACTVFGSAQVTYNPINYGNELANIGFTRGWTSFTPTFVQNGNRTATINYAKYLVVGKTAFVTVLATLTNAGTSGWGISCTLPAELSIVGGIRCIGVFEYNDAGTTNYVGAVRRASATSIDFQCHNGAGGVLGVDPLFAIANTDTIAFSLQYELA